MAIKKAVLKNFSIFSIFSICVIVRMFFVEEHMNDDTDGRLLLPLELFCKDFVDIGNENSSFRILEDSLYYKTAACLFVNYNCKLHFGL